MRPFLDVISEDLHRHEGLKGFSGFLKGWFRPGFRYTFLFRLIQFLPQSSPLRFPVRAIRRHYRFFYGYEIDMNAQIGKGFYLSDHAGSIIIGPIRIGEYCNIAHNVTIGRDYRNGVAGRPTIGNRVWIGTGAVLVGKITIGSDVMIAPNSFVNRDVPDNSIVLGNPASIIPRQNPTRYYINYILNQKDRIDHSQEFVDVV
jgi:serine O-acetyltransferase